MLILLFLLSLFGGDTAGLVFDIEKPAKEYVQDSARVKQILAINKEMLKADEALQKELKAARKTLDKLNENRQTSAAEFSAAFADMDQKNSAARGKIVTSRFRMKELMSADEWHSVYAAAGRNN